MPRKNGAAGGNGNERDTNVINIEGQRSNSFHMNRTSNRQGDLDAIDQRMQNRRNANNRQENNNNRQNNNNNNRERNNNNNREENVQVNNNQEVNNQANPQANNNQPVQQQPVRRERKRHNSFANPADPEERKRQKKAEQDAIAMKLQNDALIDQEKRAEASKKQEEERKKKKKEQKKKEEEARRKAEAEKRKKKGLEEEAEPEKKDAYSDDDMTRSNSIEQILKEGDTAEPGKKTKSGNSKEYNEIMRKSRRLKKYMAEAMEGTSVSYTRAKQISDLADELDKDMAKYQKRKGKEKNLNDESRNRLKAIKEARTVLKEQKESIKALKPKKNAFEVLDIAIKEEEKFRKDIAKEYKKHPTPENFNKMKDSIYRSMFLETLHDEFGQQHLKGKTPEEAQKKEKQLRKALKSGFANNLEVMKKISAESSFGVALDAKLKEQLKDNKYVSHEKMKKLRDDTLKDCFSKTIKTRKSLLKDPNSDQQKLIDNGKEIEMLDATAKMFGSKYTARKMGAVDKNVLKQYDQKIVRNSIDGMKPDVQAFKPVRRAPISL